MRWLRTAGLLLALAGMWPLGAWAQMEMDPVPVTLVKNTGKTATLNGVSMIAEATNGVVGAPAAGYTAIAQPFRTGASAGGYEIESVDVWNDRTLTHVFPFATLSFVVEIAEGNAAGTAPESADANVLHRWTYDNLQSTANLPGGGSGTALRIEVDVDDGTHAAPKGDSETTLSPNTTYFLVLRWANMTGTGRGFTSGPVSRDTLATDVDTDSASGWSLPGIVRGIRTPGTWVDFTSASRLLIDIEGHILPPPEISISDADAVTEGNGGTGEAPVYLEYPVSIDKAPTEPVTVSYAPVAYDRVNGPTTATAGEDFVTADASGTLTWEAGDDTDKLIRVRVIGDTLFEIDRTTFTETQDVAIMLSSPTGGATVNMDMDTASGTITDNDAKPQTTARVTTVAEGDSGDAARTLDFVVTRTGDADETVNISTEVWVQTTAGVLPGEPANLELAAYNTDFTIAGVSGISESGGAIEGGIRWGANEFERTVSLPIVLDNIAEPDKFIGFSLVRGSYMDVVGGSGDNEFERYFFGTLTDDDRGISIDSPEVTEANSGADSTLMYTVSLDGVWPHDVTVEYLVTGGDAVAGTDYNALTPGTLTITAGSTSGTIDITVPGDGDPEPDKTIEVTIRNAQCASCAANLVPTITTDVGVGTIRDNDTPRVSISSPAAVTENAGTMTFNVTPGSAPTAQGTVTWTVSSTSTAMAGTAADYTIADGSGTPLSGTLTFPIGVRTAQPITVAINDDMIHEAEETIVIDLSSPSGGVILDPAASTGTGRITDNDPIPTLSISNATVTEVDTGTSTLSFTVTKQNQTALPASVSYSVTGGTATSGTDFTAPTGTSLEFAPAETQKTIDILVTGDNLAEGNETVEITLASPSGATIAGGMGVGMGTITDDDLLEFSIDSTQVAEGAAGQMPTMTLTVSLASDHAYSISVPYTVEGSATSGTDYQAIPAGPLVFASGERTKTITVTVTGDDDSEPSETVEIVLGTPTCTGCPTGLDPSVAAGMRRGVATITNDDSPLLSISSPSVTEGDMGTVDLTYTVTLTPAVDDQTVTVSYAVTGGTAEEGVDYTAPTGSTLTFQPTVTTQTFTISVVGDEIHEGDEDETVIISLSNQTPGIELALEPGTGRIADNDPAPVLSIDPSSVSVSEGDMGTTDLAFTVTKTGNETALPATVSFAVADGTATVADGDYAAPSVTSLTFAPADTTMPITVPVTGDNRAEEDEDLTVTLSNPVGATIGTAMGTGTILDDDPLTLSINSPEVLEGDSGTANLTFEVTLASLAATQVTVAYSVSDGTATVADSDYAAPPDGTLTFPAGSMAAQSISVTVNGDENNEPHETVTVTLSSPTGGAMFVGGDTTLMGTGTILSDDLPLITVSSPSVLEGRTGTANLEFVVTMSQTWRDAVTVAYEVTDGTASASDGDYRPLADTLTFEANTTELQQTITVTVNGDHTSEGDETVTVTLSSPVNAIFDGGSSTLAGIGTILSDDRRLAISSASQVQEGDPVPEDQVAGTPRYLEYTVTLSPAAGDSPVQVGYQITDASTATPNADYGMSSPESPLTFMAGETSKTIRVAVNGDYIEEDRESVEIMLVPAGSAASVAGAVIVTRSARAYILPRKPSGSSVLSVRPGRVSSGGAGAEPTVDLTFEMNPPRTYPVTVQYQVRLQSGGSGSSLARGVGSRMLGVTATVDLAANQGMADITHRLGTSFDTANARDLEVLVEQALVASSGDPDPNVNIAGVQAAVRGGGAFTRVGATDAARLARGLGYVLSSAGRSLATGLVDALWERAAAHRAGSGEQVAVLGGRAVDTGAFAPGTDAGRAAREVAGLLGIEAIAPSVQAASYSGGVYGDGIESYREWAGLPDSGDAARRSRFALSLGGSAVGSITAWGRGDIRSYESDLADKGFASEGESFAWLFGVDYRYQEDIVVGVAVSRLSGETDYVFDDNEGEGVVETGLTSFAPWVHWTNPAGYVGYEAWGSFGTGSGTATVDEDGGKVETDVTTRILAAGVRGREMPYGRAIVAAKADMYRATLTSTAAEGGLQVADADGNSSRVRLAVEAASSSSLESGEQLTAGLDVGARFDGGGAESGMGADVAVDFRYAHPTNGIEVTWRNNWLLFHGQDGYKESAFSLGVAFDPGISGLGFHMNLEPSWNASHLGGGSMWDSGPAAGLLNQTGDGAAYRARLGYGLGALRGRALATAYGEVDGGEDARMRLGADLRNADSGISAVRLGIYGEREHSGAPGEDDTIMLEGRVGF